MEVAPSLEDYGLHNLPLGLGGEHQRVNAALAVALCKQWMMARAHSEHTTELQKVVHLLIIPVVTMLSIQIYICTLEEYTYCTNNLRRVYFEVLLQHGCKQLTRGFGRF